jgi:hypothetical protein
MKKMIVRSLLDAEIAAFGMLMVLFFLNTNRPYLLLIPVIVTIGGFFAFRMVLNKTQNHKRIIYMIAFILLASLIIAASVIGLIYIYR